MERHVASLQMTIQLGTHVNKKRPMHHIAGCDNLELNWLQDLQRNLRLQNPTVPFCSAVYSVEADGCKATLASVTKIT